MATDNTKNNDNNNTEQPELTDDQRAQLDAAKAETAAETERAEAAQREIERLEAESRQLRFGENCKDAFESAEAALGLHAYKPETALKLLTGGHLEGVKVESDEDGTARVSINGQPSSFFQALQMLFIQHPNFFKEFTPAEKQQQRPEVLARSDFRSSQHRSAWLAKYGVEAFEKLPATRDELLLDRTPHNLTQAEYKRLTYDERLKVVTQVGPDGIGKIMRRR